MKNKRNATKERFLELARRWVRDTAPLSMVQQKMEHEDFEAMVALGPSIIPYILHRAANGHRGHWALLLGRLTDERPAGLATARNPEEAELAWIAWGREKGYFQST